MQGRLRKVGARTVVHQGQESIRQKQFDLIFGLRLLAWVC